MSEMAFSTAELNLYKADPFRLHLASHGLPLSRGELAVLQVNVGKLCDLACTHCHVEAGPKRTEIMTRETAEACIAFLDRAPVRTVDITGGAPEMNWNFFLLVREARARGLEVIDRCNLTVFFLPGLEGIPYFLRDHGVHVIASLPCYTEVNVKKQRGKGVFEKSIRALQILNGLGYGKADSPLRLDLVYNPLGAALPPAQAELGEKYREMLGRHYGIVFHDLFTITNMPIRRFRHFLEREGKLEDYMNLLSEDFNVGAVERVMCRSMVNVGWDGLVYDCDFNQMLEMPLSGPDGRPLHIRELSADFHASLPIRTGEHCFGCTAGAGSSCGGALK